MEKGLSEMEIGIMNGLSASEMLLYGGLGIMTVAVAATLICIVVFRHTGRKIGEQLVQKYVKMD